MAKIAVVNASSVYNLGAARIAQFHRQQGHEVVCGSAYDIFMLEADAVYFSVVFSWDLPHLAEQADLARQNCAHIEIGGPPFAIPDNFQYIKRSTGVSPHVGLDNRFEHVPGEYELTFSSRGCPRGCSFCLVTPLEGPRLITYSDFPIPVGPNPKLGDNNLLFTSHAHQELVVRRLKNVRNLDINSGFDCRIFVKDMPKYWGLYSQLRLERWRFACDSDKQREDVQRCVEFLHTNGIKYHIITVFALVGFDGSTFEECQNRLQFLVDIGCTPYPQRYRPLNLLTLRYTPAGWTETQVKLLFDFYGVPEVWRYTTFEKYCKDYRAHSNVGQEALW